MSQKNPQITPTGTKRTHVGFESRRHDKLQEHLNFVTQEVGRRKGTELNAAVTAAYAKMFRGYLNLTRADGNGGFMRMIQPSPVVTNEEQRLMDEHLAAARAEAEAKRASTEDLTDEEIARLFGIWPDDKNQGNIP